MAGKNLLLSANELIRVDPDSRQTEIGMGAAISAFTPYGMSESGASCPTMSLCKQFVVCPKSSCSGLAEEWDVNWWRTPPALFTQQDPVDVQ